MAVDVALRMQNAVEMSAHDGAQDIRNLKTQKAMLKEDLEKSKSVADKAIGEAMQVQEEASTARHKFEMMRQERDRLKLDL
ncbi:hypothetical protein Dimus_005166, partial [Dionaea muscipula]